MRIRDRKPLLAVMAVTGVAAVVLLVLLVGDEDKPPAPTERTTPPLAGTAVRGGKVSLERLRGHVVLVSFLNTRAGGTLRNDASRAQVVFLRSMQTQHASFGLRVIIVDAAEVAGAGRPSRNELVNYTYDWNLDRAIALLADDGSLARRFSVRSAPTTFLIDQHGVSRRRWNGFAGAAELDFAIRSLEGRSPTD